MLGSKAPDFALDSSTGQQICLNDLKGSHIVLVFYPANDTPVCNRQLDEMNFKLEEFLEHNAHVFGVNTASQQKQKAYCLRRKLEFPILSDPGAKVAREYKAVMPFLPVVRRTVVAINPQGTICFYQRGKPDPSEVLKTIKSEHAM